MQVLVLIVQNTSSFEDLGVATSGVTFFRTIGSSFGAAIFGSLFTNFLHSRIGPALAASGASPAAANSPEALHRLPHEVAAPIVGAYAASLTQVFLWAVPVALVGFVLALFLREVPLRDIGNNAADLGDGFAMPTTQTPEDMLENGDRAPDAWRTRYAAAQHRHATRLPARRRRVVGAAAHQPLSAGTGYRPDHRHRQTSSGFRTRSSNPPSIAWSATVTRNATSTSIGSPRPVPAKSTSSRRCCRAGSSTSSPAHRTSQGRPGPSSGRGRAEPDHSSDRRATGLG